MYIQVTTFSDLQAFYISALGEDVRARPEADSVSRGAPETEQETGGDGAASSSPLHLPGHPGGGRQEEVLQPPVFEEGGGHCRHLRGGPRRGDEDQANLSRETQQTFPLLDVPGIVHTNLYRSLL